MAKVKKKWGFLAPTRAKAKEMEEKYDEHFTPLIDYMKVIFPDFDDWDENEIKELDVVICYSNQGKKFVILRTDAFIDIKFEPKNNFIGYYIDYATQLTNATVKHIFGIDVVETLFDENMPTITQPWVEHALEDNAETALKGKYVGDAKQYQVNFDAYRAKYDNIGLSKIFVEDMFDLYSYEIDLNIDKNISILIGPNGCGKTTILKIVSFMLSGFGDIKEIMKIPFSSITCVLTNGRKIKLKSSSDKLTAFIDNKKVGIFYQNEKYYHKDAEFSSWSKSCTKELQEQTKLTINKTNNILEKVVHIEEELTIENAEKQLSSLDNVFKNLIESSDDTKGDYRAKMIFEASLRKYGCHFDTEFMSAQRLFSKIRNVKEKNEKVHQYLDTISKIKGDFKRFWIDKSGIVSDEKTTQKTMLFQKIINDRFKITHKQLQYSFGKMRLIIDDGKEIPLDVLSSGEKNDFIMFYNLIFNCKNSKVFIDEPEISLHIEWQERFIDDLYEICKMNNIQALVATHSPNIINDHLDLIANWDIKDV